MCKRTVGQRKITSINRRASNSDWLLYFSSCVIFRSWLQSLAVTRGAFVAVEQPQNSLLFKEPCMLATAAMFKMRLVHTCLGGFGATSVKPLHILTTIPKEAEAPIIFRKKKKHPRSHHPESRRGETAGELQAETCITRTACG